jgi:hypothetical protein
MQPWLGNRVIKVATLQITSHSAISIYMFKLYGPFRNSLLEKIPLYG